jgi:hypothetical protein
MPRFTSRPVYGSTKLTRQRTCGRPLDYFTTNFNYPGFERTMSRLWCPNSIRRWIQRNMPQWSFVEYVVDSNGSGNHQLKSILYNIGRCSITSFVMSTTMVRTCIGCNRKAFLPRSSKIPSGTENWLPRVAQSWVVEEFLEAVHRCLFCGNGFVSILY